MRIIEMKLKLIKCILDKIILNFDFYKLDYPWESDQVDIYGHIGGIFSYVKFFFIISTVVRPYCSFFIINYHKYYNYFPLY